MATYTSNYAWTKPSGGDPVDIEVLNDNLDDQDSIVHQAFLDLAPVFSTANTYAVKDVVLYDNKVWICHTAVTTAGAWTGSTNWTRTTVGETGGVATYADLPDKPSINGNELSGNKTGAQLGLQNTLAFDNVPTANSNNPVKSGGVYASDEAIRKWTTAEAKSASGNPITLLDGSARNAEGLSVTCNPKQNLHGYDHPWAAGAGKNKMPMTVANLKAINTRGTWSGNDYTYHDVTITVLTDTDGNITGFKFNGTNNAHGEFFLNSALGLTSGDYILSGAHSSNKRLYFYNGTSYHDDNGSGINFAISGTETTQKVAIVLTNGSTYNNEVFYPMIRLASVSDATFAPYSNECPITGYTECVVDDHGANVIPMPTVTTIDSTKSGIRVQHTSGDDFYTYVGTASNKDINVWLMGTYNASVHALFLKKGTYYVKGVDLYDIAAGGTSFTNGREGGFYTLTEDRWINGVRVISAVVNTQYNETIYPYIIKVADTSVAPPYEPYIAKSATITLGTTVYGGSVDFKMGKVTVDKVSVVLDGSDDENWDVNSNRFRYRSVSCINNSSRVNGISNYIECKSADNVYTNRQTANYVGLSANGSEINVVDNIHFANDDLTAWKTYLANNPLQVCYELATPTELTLTPAELELLKGYNYISTNGTTISLNYLPDSLLAEAENYVDAKIPPAPTTDGTYVLTCTVTSGVPAYTWESAT